MNESSTKIEVIIEKYLKEQLSEEERSVFEAEMLENSELLEQVQRMDSFRDDLQNVSGLDQKHKINASELEDSQKAIIRPNFSQWIRYPYSIAASLLLSIGIILGLPMSLNNSQNLSGSSELASIQSSVMLESFRGELNRLEINNSTPILVSIDVGPESSGPFTITIVDEQSNTVIAELENVELEERGLVRVLLSAKLIGNHTINASSISNPNGLSYFVEFTE